MRAVSGIGRFCEPLNEVLTRKSRLPNGSPSVGVSWLAQFARRREFVCGVEETSGEHRPNRSAARKQCEKWGTRSGMRATCRRQSFRCTSKPLPHPLRAPSFSGSRCPSRIQQVRQRIPIVVEIQVLTSSISPRARRRCTRRSTTPGSSPRR